MNKTRNIKAVMIIAMVTVAVILTARATLGQASSPAQHQHYYGCEHYQQNSNYNGHEHYYGCGHGSANQNYSRQWNNGHYDSGQYNDNWHGGQRMSRQNYRGGSRANAPAPNNGRHYYGCGCGFYGGNGYYQNGGYSSGGWGCW